MGGTEWRGAHDTVVKSTVTLPSSLTGAITINGVSIPTGGSPAGLVTSINSSVATAGTGSQIEFITASITSGVFKIISTDGEDIVLTGAALADLGIAATTHRGVTVTVTNSNNFNYPANSVAGDIWIKGSTTNRGADFVVKSFNNVTRNWVRHAAPVWIFDSATDSDTAGMADINVRKGATNGIGLMYVGIDVTDDGVITQFRRYIGNGDFEVLSYEASDSAPVGEPVEGAMWYSDNFRADIMIADGDQWLRYRNKYPLTNGAGPIIAGSAPIRQTVARGDGKTNLVNNDLWIDASDLENYPKLYRYDGVAGRWVLIDSTDQTSPFGVIFADARGDSGVHVAAEDTYVEHSEAMADLLTSDFVDPDAPDPRTVPSGMLLFNTRYSTGNVKQWRSGYFDKGGFDANTDYSTASYNVGATVFGSGLLGEFAADITVEPSLGRWVTISGNRTNGSALMGRRAQRAVIVKAMAAAIAGSDEARSEIINFNLLSAPGYPELMDDLIALNTDQKNTAFVVGDTPIRLEPSTQKIMAWANNAYGASYTSEDALLRDEGSQTASEYAAVYYPWGLSTNIDGSAVMIPPSAMALRTIAYNDQVAYPWFAPAGYQRGIVTNASAVGYLTKEGEFKSVILNQGVRDTLYENGINPIAYMNRGLVVYGQKTLAVTASAMDRINVARLVNYMNVALDNLGKPFLWHQNDEQTRDSFKAAIERFLNGLAGLRALEDYAVQVDTENNTPERVARNELWADIAILPTKSVEFIYIPIRLTLGETNDS